MRAPALITALLLALPLAGASILPPSDLPVLVHAEGDGHGWMSMRVRTDGSPFVVEIEGLGAQAPVLVIMDMLDGSGASLGHGLTGGFSGWQGAYVTGSLAGQDARVEQMSGQGSLGFGLNALFNDPAAPGPRLVGTYAFVMWVGGETRSWDGDVRGGPGIEVLGVDHGERTMLASARSFQATANAGATALGLSAHAVVDGTVRFHAEDHPFGLYEPWLPGAWTTTTMDTPAGTQACACERFDASGPGALGPGDYAFHLTGASAGLEGPDDVFLTFADARVP